MNIISKYLKDTSDFDSKTNFTINTRKIDDLIYLNNKEKQEDLYKGDSYSLSNIENDGNKKMGTFSDLTKDIFSSLYKKEISKNDISKLTDTAKRFNLNIINKMLETEEFKSLRETTMANAGDSIEASNLLMSELLNDLDLYLKEIYDNQSEEILDKYKQLIKDKKEQIIKEVTKYQQDDDNSSYEKTQQKVKTLEQQIDGLKKIIDKADSQISENAEYNSNKIKAIMSTSLKKVANELELNSVISNSFGIDKPTSNAKILENKKLVKQIKKNNKIIKLAKLLGDLKPILKKKESSKYTKGRGELVGIELGNDIDKIYESELMLLAHKDTRIEFYKKYADDELLLYKQAHKLPRGKGNCIVIADESSSTMSSNSNEFAPYYFTKGIAISISQLLVSEKRETNYVPFSSELGEVLTINKDTFNPETMKKLALNFMSGGTDFNIPIRYVLNLIKDDNFKLNSDIIFITDGESRIEDDLVSEFNMICKKKKIKCLGILLDYDNIVNDNEVKKFCSKVMKITDFGINGIANEVFERVTR